MTYLALPVSQNLNGNHGFSGIVFQRVELSEPVEECLSWKKFDYITLISYIT
jgi:hypothetical protein